jgi:ketosteroid isomerase-like protein
MNGTIDREADIRAQIQQHWEASERGDGDVEHAIYAEDAILDYPQSGERFRGRSRIQQQRSGHPAERHFTIRRILGSGDLWVSECVISYDGVPTYGQRHGDHRRFRVPRDAVLRRSLPRGPRARGAR